ncbi:MAG: hypothetical protein R8K47_05275, partial [Mariprofundaceae bacterium]
MVAAAGFKEVAWVQLLAAGAVAVGAWMLRVGVAALSVLAGAGLMAVNGVVMARAIRRIPAGDPEAARRALMKNAA